MQNRITRLFSSLSLGRGLAYVSIGNIVSIGLGGLLWFFLATQMDATNYGSLNYYISVSTIALSVGIMGFESTLPTFLPKGITRMLGQASALILISGVGLSIVLYIIFGSLSLVLAFVGLLFSTYSLAELLGKYLYKEFMILLIVSRLITLVSVPLLFNLYGVDGALYGYAISLFPVSYRFFISLRKFDLSLSTLTPIKNFFFHSYVLGISKNLVFFSDKLLIMPIFGLGILGSYQFGLQVLTAVSVIPIILYDYLLPQWAGDKKIEGKKIQLTGLLTSLAITVTMIFLIPQIITNLFPSFLNSVLSTQIILLAGIPLTMIAIFNSSLMANEKSYYVIAATGIFLATQYILIVCLGSLYGLVGLSISTVVASTAQATYLVMMTRKVKLSDSQIAK
jgi:O-antigen/teichoic acid export membrane protein